MKYECIKYKYIRGRLQTGDIILFSGKGLGSLFIRLVTGSNLSHVGMVRKSPHTGQLSCLESTIGEEKSGFQMNPLGKRIKQYKGKIWIRHLITERTDQMEENLQEFILANLHTSYESGFIGLIELLSAVLDFWPFNNKPNAKQLFCSELVTIILQRWKLLAAEVSANELLPRGYEFGRKMDKLLKLSPKPACLAKPVRVK